MKKFAWAVLLALAAFPAAAKDLSTKATAKIDITTNTSYGVNLDNPLQRGLKMDFTHFGISYDLAPGGLLTNAVKTDDPFGFIQVEFGGLSLAWNNKDSLYDKDMNNNTSADTNLGFNKSDTGYTYPIYLERFSSGIQWGDWYLQLAAGGDEPENWRPWSNHLRGYIKSEFLQRWAYQDTRIQYQRPNVPTLLALQSATGIPSEQQYWNHGNPVDGGASGVLRDIVLNPQGTLVGLNYNAQDWSVMGKFVTEKTWTDSVTDAPGQAFGLDFALTPQAVPALKAYASVGIQQDYGTDSDPQPWAAGGKAGYTFPVTDTLSLEPYFGVQVKQWDQVGNLSGTIYQNAHEASAGLTLHWPGDGGWQWDPLQQRNGVLFPGLTAAYTYRDHNDKVAAALQNENPIQSILVTLYEESGDAGLLEGLGAEAAVQYNDFQNFTKSFGAHENLSQLLVTTYLDYTIPDVLRGNLIPWTKVYYDALARPDGSRVNNVKADAGLRLEKAIKNTVLGVTYESKNLLGTSASKGDLVSGSRGYGLARIWAEVHL